MKLSPEDKADIRYEIKGGRAAWQWFADQIPDRLTYHKPSGIYYEFLRLIESAPRETTAHVLDMVWADFYLSSRYYRPVCWKPLGPWAGAEWEELQDEATDAFGWIYREFLKSCSTYSGPGFSDLVPYLQPLLVPRRNQLAYRLTSFALADFYARERGARLTWSPEPRAQQRGAAQRTSR